MSDETLISYEINVGDQAFSVKIEQDQKADYDRIARYTSKVFEEVAEQTLAQGPHAWSMAAFQIACDLFDLNEQMQQNMTELDSSKEAEARIKRMIRRIESTTTRT